MNRKKPNVTLIKISQCIGGEFQGLKGSGPKKKETEEVKERRKQINKDKKKKEKMKALKQNKHIYPDKVRVSQSLGRNSNSRFLECDLKC